MNLALLTERFFLLTEVMRGRLLVSTWLQKEQFSISISAKQAKQIQDFYYLGRMKKILCLLLAFMVIGPLYSQYSEEEVSVIVSQGWDYITDGRQIDSAFSVVQKLEKNLRRSGK